MVGGLGRQKMGVTSYAHMLICSLLFVCEHLFTFQFCVLMPKISKENFAKMSYLVRAMIERYFRDTLRVIYSL